MLNIDRRRLKTDPFPYLVQENLFDQAFYRRLKDAYPPFTENETWRRMSADLIHGDDLYAEVIGSEPWNSVHAYLNSNAFLDCLAHLFKSHLVPGEAAVDFDDLRLADCLETREWLASNNVPEAIKAFDGDRRDVFVRMDFGRGAEGYYRQPHVDWRHRLCSLLIYFDDADENGMVGGELVVHQEGESAQDHRDHEIIPPRDNLGVFKLDNNRSIHSVKKLRSINGSRRTVFVALSSRGQIW